MGGRLEYIDSIRGIAALAVIYFHIAEGALASGNVSALERPALSLFSETIDTGKIAVTLFFMVSGFVVPFFVAERQGAARSGFYHKQGLSIVSCVLAFNPRRVVHSSRLPGIG